jgi:hypothetical protein
VISSYNVSGQIALWPFTENTKDNVGIFNGTPSASGVSFVTDSERGNVMLLDGVSGMITLPAQFIWRIG